jgi:hypothetical protein
VSTRELKRGQNEKAGIVLKLVRKIIFAARFITQRNDVL